MIGISLIDELLKDDCKIFAVIRPNSKKKEKLPQTDRLQIVECALNSLDSLSELIDDTCDTFYHLAWDGSGRDRNDNLSLQISNVENTLTAVKVAKVLGCNKFIFAGSQAQYGRCDFAIDENTIPNPSEPYGICKLTAEKLSRILCNRLDISHISARIFSVYGKNSRPDAVINQVIEQLTLGKEIALSSGEQYWDFLYEKDAGRALKLVGYNGSADNAYNIAFGEKKKLKEYLLLLGKILDGTKLLKFGDYESDSSKLTNLIADTTKLKDELNFTPNYSFADGIKDMLK